MYNSIESRQPYKTPRKRVEGSDRRLLINFGESNFNHFTESVSIAKTKSHNIYQRFLFSLFGTSIMSWIVESKTIKSIAKVCKSAPFFNSSLLFFPYYCISSFLQSILKKSRLYESRVCNHQSSFLSPFLYTIDMISVLQVTAMVPSFQQDS